MAPTESGHLCRSAGMQLPYKTGLFSLFQLHLLFSVGKDNNVFTAGSCCGNTISEYRTAMCESASQRQGLPLCQLWGETFLWTYY